MKINPFFWFVLGIGMITGYFREVIMVFMIVFVHEMGHALAAHYFKWNIRKIELLPFGGVAEMNESTNRPMREELIVVLAGPFQHLWMIGLSFLFLPFSFWTVQDHQLFLMHNLMILGFNMLPIWPLDGGRLVHLLCCKHWPYKRASEYTLFFSVSAIVALLAVTITLLPFHLNLWVVISFLFIANYLEWKQRHYTFMRFLLERQSNPLTYYEKRQISVTNNTLIKDALQKLYRDYYHTISVGVTMNIKEEEILEKYFKEKKVNDKIVDVFK